MSTDRLAELLERMGAEIGGCICSTCVGRQVGWVAEHRDEWLRALGGEAWLLSSRQTRAAERSRRPRPHLGRFGE